MKKLTILIASLVLLALAATGCGKADTATEQTTEGAGETGMQIASAWLINGDDETRTLVTIDLSGGWSVEFAPGAFYMYEDMQSKEDETSAMGITLSKEVYDEYVAEAKKSDSYKELDDAIMYENESDETVYLFTVGENGYFHLSVKKDIDGDAVFRRVTTEAEESPQTSLYGEDSKLYLIEEMDAAVAKILEMFETWKGCEMKKITYAGDACNSEENIARMNELKEGQNYTQCIEFLTDFHSPVEAADLEGTAWDPDTDYNDYQWWLARTEGGEWELVSWGY